MQLHLNPREPDLSRACVLTVEPLACTAERLLWLKQWRCGKVWRRDKRGSTGTGGTGARDRCRDRPVLLSEGSTAAFCRYFSSDWDSREAAQTPGAVQGRNRPSLPPYPPPVSFSWAAAGVHSGAGSAAGAPQCAVRLVIITSSYCFTFMPLTNSFNYKLTSPVEKIDTAALLTAQKNVHEVSYPPGNETVTKGPFC